MLLAAIAQQLPQFESIRQLKIPADMPRESSVSAATEAGWMMLRLLPVIEIDEGTVSARPGAEVQVAERDASKPPLDGVYGAG